MVVTRETSQHLADVLRREDACAPDPWSRLLDTAALDTARQTREFARWDRLAEVESATWAGLLIDMIEGAHMISIRTGIGQTLVGHIRAVGADSVALVHNTELVVLTFDAIAAIESLHEDVDALSERTPSSFSLRSCIQRAAEERPDVVISLASSGQVLTGRLRSCGADLCTLTAVEFSRKRTHVALSAIAMIRILP